MPETPGSEGRRATPPPLPHERHETADSGAPPSLGSGSVPPLAAPGQGLDRAPLEELAELLYRECEATTDVARRSDLQIRLALLAWDILGDVDTSHRHAASAAGEHPLGARVLLAQALSEASPEAIRAKLEAAEAAVQKLPHGPAASRGPLLREVAESWLYRVGDAARAVHVLKELFDQGADREARDLLPLALGLAGEWSELVALLAAESAPPLLIEAAHLVADRLDDTTRAVEWLMRARAGDQNPYALERLLEIAGTSTPPDGLDVGALYRRKLDLCGSDVEARLEKQATTFLYAAHLERTGAPADAVAMLSQLTVDAAKPEAAAWGPRLALAVRRRVQTARGAWQDAAATARELARGVPAPLSRAYLRRAAEIYEARAADDASAVELFAELWTADPGDPGVARALERLRLVRREFGQLLAQLELGARQRAESRPTSLRRAAAVAESRLGDLDTAIRLRREALLGDQDAGGHEDLARLHRRHGDRTRLSQAYRKSAQLAADDRVAAAWMCAAGSIDLAIGHVREAEDAFKDAARRAPRDVCARLALTTLYRRSSRWRELAETLEALAPLTAHDGLRATTLRELGRITATRLGDPKGARAHLERALSLAPRDAGVLHALAELCGDAGDWPSAVAMRERAVEASSDRLAAAQILLEIGDIEERHRKDDEASRRAYERALEKDDGSVEALRALAQLHRKAKRHLELLRVLRRELELTQDPQRRLTLLLEIARHADQAEGDAAASLDGYRSALSIDPANVPALAGLERICRRDGRWEVLAQALRGAPRTQRNLRALGEALEKLEQWKDLAEVRRAELDITEDRKEAARTASALAQLHEEKLRDENGAVKMYTRAFDLDPADTRPLRAMARLFEERERWAELTEVLERELGQAGAVDAARRVALLKRVGELRATRLDRPGEAAGAYELVLEVDPRDMHALVALEQIYGRLAREGDLLRILERKAEATEDKTARAEMYARIADIREKRGDGDASLAMYREAFLADPANRNTFTALERLCYKRERWREAMELYDIAIALIEGGKSRAYRLGDLYARRGQIQLQYLGQPGEAAASYLRVIELDPDNDTSLKFLESIFSQQGDWVGLISAYERRAELTTDDDRRIETLRRAARVAAAKRKDSAEAARLYERILEVDPAENEALDALERYYERSRDWNKLVSVLTMRLATAPAGDAAVAMLTRIAQICEEGLRDESRAIDHYRRILEIAPGNKDALEALGRIYESTEKWAEFVDVTRRQIRITTDRNVKALMYFKCGSVMESKFSKEEDAIRYYDAAIKTSPSCLPAVHGLRDLYLRRKDWPRVIQTLELEVKLWQDDKERAGVFAQIGQIYGDHLHDPDRALHYFESALAVDPDCLPANRALFELHYSRGDWTRAAPLGQALAQKAMREGDPTERSEFYRKRGIVAWRTGEPRVAAESYIIALEIKPENLLALEELGRLSRGEPDAYDFAATCRELEKIYRKRDAVEAHLARVLVMQAGIVERGGDLDAAEKIYSDACALAPHDFTILSALVDLHANMRRWSHAAEAIVKFLDRPTPPPKDVRVQALLRLAEIHGDGEMDPHRAAGVLREVLRHDPGNQDALYRLAQELYVTGRYAEAKGNIERVIQLAAAPGAPLSPEALARYYYYLGRIVDAMGDSRGAGSQYRRAAEYDPGYAPPALALAKRAVQGGDRRTAETTLIQAAHTAMEQGGPRAAIPLQRGLARILLAASERHAAIEAYRGILAVEPDGNDDRVALAEVYAMEDLPKAIQEVHRVLDRDLRHAPAYRLLASLYDRTTEHERAMRVSSILELLGYSDEGERVALAQLRARHGFVARRATLPDELRQLLLLPPAARSPLGEIYAAVAEPIAQLHLMPPAGTNLVPHTQFDDPTFKIVVSDTARLFGVEPEVYVGEQVHGGMIVLLFPRPIVTMTREYATLPDPERRFLLGRAYESIRGGYAPLLRLGPRERSEIGALLRAILMPEADRPAAAQEFLKQLSRKSAKALERFAGMHAAVEPDPWIAALAQAQDRAGLLACDDFAAAARALARLSGEELAMTDDGAVALGAVPGGKELVRYFLSDDYQRLRLALGDPTRM